MILIDHLFNLPDDLIIHLLSTWWNWLDISHLDRSLVNRDFRRKYLTLLESHSIVLSCLGDYEISKLRNSWRSQSRPISIPQFSFKKEDRCYFAKLFWLRERNLQLQDMMVGCLVSALLIKKIYPALGTKVKSFSYETMYDQDVDLAQCGPSPWLNLCPNLQSFTSHLIFDNDVLLSWLQSKLMHDQLLKLTLTSIINPSDLETIHQTLPNLQSLHLIAKQYYHPSRTYFIPANKFFLFHDRVHLHELACNYVISSPTTGADVIITLLDLVLWKTLHTLSVPLDDGVVVKFVKRCPNLQIISPNNKLVDSNSSLSSSSLHKQIATIFDYLPNVKVKQW